MGSKKAKVVALSMALMAPVGIWFAQASAAAPAGVTLIDKDFEQAVRKFISKRVYNRIDATDAQREQLDKIWINTMESTRPDREQVRQDALQLSNLMASDDATDEQITEKAHEIRALHQKVMDQRLDSLLKARKVLTKEQRSKINERITELITGGFKPRRVGLLMDRF